MKRIISLFMMIFIFGCSNSVMKNKETLVVELKSVIKAQNVNGLIELLHPKCKDLVGHNNNKYIKFLLKASESCFSEESEVKLTEFGNATLPSSQRWPVKPKYILHLCSIAIPITEDEFGWSVVIGIPNEKTMKVINEINLDNYVPPVPDLKSNIKRKKLI